MTAGKKAAAVSAERRSRYLFRVLMVFIIGAVRVINDNIVELEAAAWFEGRKVCRRPSCRPARAYRLIEIFWLCKRVRIKKPGGNQMSETTESGETDQVRQRTGLGKRTANDRGSASMLACKIERILLVGCKAY